MKKLLFLLAFCLAPLANAMEQPKDLFQAAKDGDLQRITELAQGTNWNPNQVDKNGVTALLHASYYGHLEVVTFLLKNGADPDKQNELFFILRAKKELTDSDKTNLTNLNEETALMCAAEHGHLEVVKELLKFHANPNLQTVAGTTALYFASYRDFLDIIKELLRMGADPSLRNVNTHSLIAVNLRSREIIEALLTTISNTDAAPLFETLWACQNSGFIKDSHSCITILERVIPEIIEKKMVQVNSLLNFTYEGETAREKVLWSQNFAEYHNKPISHFQDLAALLDPNNNESQKYLRKKIEENLNKIVDHCVKMD